MTFCLDYDLSYDLKLFIDVRNVYQMLFPSFSFYHCYPMFISLPMFFPVTLGLKNNAVDRQ